ncbi:MAG: hypothetical protein SFU91_06775 [Chloroherpetonaceae bacterium]|nr:hypothetical protein [Chloroherpetonaceae bacterium]
MRNRSLLISLFLVIYLWGCDESLTNQPIITPPPRTSSNFSIVSPRDSAVIVIPDSTPVLGLKWNVPIDITGQLRYTVLLDRDDDFSNGALLFYDTFSDTLALSREFLLNLPSRTDADTLLYYRVFVSNANEYYLSGNSIHRIKLFVK